jgi:hypothetical protein
MRKVPEPLLARAAVVAVLPKFRPLHHAENTPLKDCEKTQVYQPELGKKKAESKVAEVDAVTTRRVDVLVVCTATDALLPPES